VFNLGVGMVAVAPENSVDAALTAIREVGVGAAPIGHVEAGERGIELVGSVRWGAAEAGQAWSA
jgi:phosphoribosylaminoimidazole (AIR) synthetase